MAQSVVEAERLTKRFGGLAAVDRVDLAVAAGEVHAVIGPNGAGKTTLLSLLSGELHADAGAVRIEDEDVTALPVHRRAGRGLARTFQITSVFDELSLRENMLLAVQAARGHAYRLWTAPAGDGALTARADSILGDMGFADRAELPAALLSHGERRALELAMALATEPRVLLLDEPMAGIGAKETGEIVDRLRRLKGRLTIILIEHDMEAVFALADTITVLASGKVIARGRPEEISANPLVQSVYLGGEED